jgi:hypothetical protein
MDTTIQSLAQAAQGLMFMSESDYPLTVMQWPPLPATTTPEHLLESLIPGATWQTRSVEEFFGPRVRIEDWMTDQEKNDSRQMAEVSRYILALDPAAQVFCSDENPKQCYILGKTTADIWFAVHTQVVET